MQKIVLLLIALLVVTTSAMAKEPAQETAYARVMRTKTIRCGYVNYQPGIFKDPLTGEMNGIVHDVIESVAKKLAFKMQWTEETSWGQHLEGLKTGRYDVLCAASFSLPSDTLWSEPVGPLYYSTIGVWVRPGNRRFVENYAAINNPTITVSAIDGTIPAIIAAEDFSRAHIVSMPQFTDYTLNMQNVAQRKADVTFVETWQGNAFVSKNPGSLVNLGAAKPLRVYPDNMLVGKGQFELQSMLNSVIAQMQDNGEIETILQRYERTRGSLLRVAPRYSRNSISSPH